jgi:hypothetical protein
MLIRPMSAPTDDDRWGTNQMRQRLGPREHLRRGNALLVVIVAGQRISVLESQRRPDPFVAVTPMVRGWFEVEPWRTSRELFERLQGERPGVFPDGQLRTLQRRMKEWRRERARELVFGAAVVEETLAEASLPPDI